MFSSFTRVRRASHIAILSSYFLTIPFSLLVFAEGERDDSCRVDLQEAPIPDAGFRIRQREQLPVDPALRGQVSQIQAAMGAARGQVGLPPRMPAFDSTTIESQKELEEINAAAQGVVQAIIQNAQDLSLGQVEQTVTLQLQTVQDEAGLSLSSLSKPLRILQYAQDVAPKGEQLRNLQELVTTLENYREQSGRRTSEEQSWAMRQVVRVTRVASKKLANKLERRRDQQIQEARTEYVDKYMTAQEAITYVTQNLSEGILELEGEMAEIRTNREKMIALRQKLLRSVAFGLAVDDALLDHLEKNTTPDDPSRRVIVEHGLTPLRKLLTSVLELSAFTNQSIERSYLSVAAHRDVVADLKRTLMIMPPVIEMAAQQAMEIQSRAHWMRVGATVRETTNRMLRDNTAAYSKQADAIMDRAGSTALDVAALREAATEIVRIRQKLSTYWQKQATELAGHAHVLSEISKTFDKTLPAHERSERIADSMANLLGGQVTPDTSKTNGMPSSEYLNALAQRAVHTNRRN